MDIYSKLKKDFKKNKDKEKSFQFQKYMRNKFKFYGIQASKRKCFYKEFLKEERKNKKINWKLLDKCEIIR